MDNELDQLRVLSQSIIDTGNQYNEIMEQNEASQSMINMEDAP